MRIQPFVSGSRGLVEETPENFFPLLPFEDTARSWSLNQEVGPPIILNMLAP